MTDLEIVQKDRDSLYIGNIRTVEFDLNLPVKGENGSEITWETGHDRELSVHRERLHDLNMEWEAAQFLLQQLFAMEKKRQ